MDPFVSRSGALLFAGATATAQAQDWSRFRGPNGTGIVPDAGYPTEFGPDRNLKWRSAVRPGKSSPVLSARHIFLTAYDEGALFTQCFDRATGRLLWERKESPARHEVAHVLSEPAAATPVTDGENVYVFFRDFGVVSYDAAGAVRWKKPMGPFNNRMGAVASPIIAGSALVVVLDQIEGIRDRRAVAGDGRGEVADRAAGAGRLDDAGPLRAAGTAGADRHGRRRHVRRPLGRERRPAVDPQGHGAGHGRQPGRHRRHRGGLRLRLRRDAAVRRCAGEERQGRRRPALGRGVRQRGARGGSASPSTSAIATASSSRASGSPPTPRSRRRRAWSPCPWSRTRTASSARASCGATRRASSPSCRRRWSSTGWSTRSRTAASSPCCAPTPARS